MKKLLPIGLSDFKKVIEENYYYVDKTLLIKEVHESGNVVLIPRPRRFGKTLNLSMLRYYYEKSEHSTEHLFKNYAIWQHEKYKALQGKFPVIFLSFKSVTLESFNDAYDQITSLIAEEFDQYKYLLTGDFLSPYERTVFENISQAKASKAELVKSIYFLAKLLYRYHEKNVIILIDEYDTPIQTAFIHSFYDEMLEIMKPLLASAFKDNKFLEKGVLTGILMLAKAGIFSGLNNLQVFNLTEESFADKFGFTIEESEQLLQYYDIKEHSAVKQWYNGYIFGTTNGIFNPWSLIQCIKQKGSLGMYWVNTSDNVLLKRLITRAHQSTKIELEKLLNDKKITGNFPCRALYFSCCQIA